jgi:hypothetical protein
MISNSANRLGVCYLNCSRCMSSFVAFESRRISFTERSRSSFVLFVPLLCAGSLSLSLPMMPLAAVSQKSRRSVLESMLEPIASVV